MLGNVETWCQDLWDENFYSYSPRENPEGPATGIYYLLRGGSCNLGLMENRSAYRFRNIPDAGLPDTGLRVVLTPASTPP
jgi:formylglycine-generating enzyme required for sulfatase activity